MHPRSRVDLLLRYRREGFEVEDVGSDHEALHVRLRRGSEVVDLELGPEDAAVLLAVPRAAIAAP